MQITDSFSRQGQRYGELHMGKNETDDAAIALRKEKERARMAAYRAANPEKVRASKAKYYAANREKVKARVNEYHAANPEKAKTYAAKYYEANREKVKARVKEYSPMRTYCCIRAQKPVKSKLKDNQNSIFLRKNFLLTDIPFLVSQS